MRTVLLITTVVFVLSIFSGEGLCNDPALDKAWTFYLKSDYKNTLDACRVVSRKRALGEEGRYLMGLSFLKLGRQKEAQENFEFVMKNYPSSDLKEELLLGIGDSYYLDGNFNQAEEYYYRLLKNFKSTHYASMAYLNLGKALRKQGKWKAADSSFSKVTYSWPTSLEAKEAKKYLSKDNFFSIQLGAFAKTDNALSLLTSLRKKGYSAKIERHRDKEKVLYRVKTGRFDKKGKAQEEAKRLKKDGFTPRVTS